MSTIYSERMIIKIKITKKEESFLSSIAQYVYKDGSCTIRVALPSILYREDHWPEEEWELMNFEDAFELIAKAKRIQQ